MIKVNFSAKCDIDIYFDVPIMSASVANEFDCRSTFEYINRNNLSPVNLSPVNNYELKGGVKENFTLNPEKFDLPKKDPSLY